MIVESRVRKIHYNTNLANLSYDHRHRDVTQRQAKCNPELQAPSSLLPGRAPIPLSEATAPFQLQPGTVHPRGNPPTLPRCFRRHCSLTLKRKIFTKASRLRLLHAVNRSEQDAVTKSRNNQSCECDSIMDSTHLQIIARQRSIS